AVQRDGYWLSCGRYIERNPVEAGLAFRPWDYAWSSSAAYALGQRDALLGANPFYQKLSPVCQRRQQPWRGICLGGGCAEGRGRCVEGIGRSVKRAFGCAWRSCWAGRRRGGVVDPPSKLRGTNSCRRGEFLCKT